MQFTLTALGIISLLELLLWLRPIWNFRRPLSLIVATGFALITSALLAANLTTWTLLIAIFSLYKIINLLRLYKNRLHDNHLFHSSLSTSLLLTIFQLTVLGFAWLDQFRQGNLVGYFYFLVGFQILGGAIVLASTLRHSRTTRPPRLSLALADKDLPTLTVAIPARNETKDLEDCLSSLVKSTYPKLEILVLDDCSQNKRTPEIIGDFAQAGVRFVAGKQPPESWLPKNYAYHQLAEEANGDMILFCGVDARFKPYSLDSIVKLLLQKQKTMMSIMPLNVRTWGINPLNTIYQTNRYAWELALPRRILERPPVLSTCWIITRAAFEENGGFGATRRSVIPEGYFARGTAAKDDGYSFIRSGSVIGLTSTKLPAEQRATAIRTRYPQLHRRPEVTVLVSLLEGSLLVWPLIMGIISLISDAWLLTALSGLAYLLQALSYSLVHKLAYGRFSTIGLLILPLATLYDIWLLNYSMWQYEFREVIWKGRNVCLPVMRVVPHLPKAD